MVSKICRNPNCKKKLPAHLTSASHCNEDCYKEAKKLRQKKVDDLIKPFRKGIYANFKLFEELLPEAGQFAIAVTEARVRGFDEHAFYGIVRDTQNSSWYKVDVYYFSIKEENQQQKLTIHKS